MPDTILITGGAGNLACNLTFRLVGAGRRVVLSDVAPSPLGPVAAGTEYVTGDVTRAAGFRALVERVRPRTILHFASLLSGRSEEDRDLAWRVNMEGAFTVFETALACGVTQVLFPSSVASFGAPLPNPVPEDQPQWPLGFYGVTKACVERLGVYYHARHGLDFRAIRVPIVLSPQANAAAASAYASLAFLESAAHGRFVFRVRPESRPALIYVKDVLAAFVKLMEAPAERLTRRIYDVQALSPTARELAEAIRARVPGVDLSFDPDPVVADLIDSWPIEFVDESARRDWGWSPEYDLARTADDFLSELRT